MEMFAPLARPAGSADAGYLVVATGGALPENCQHGRRERGTTVLSFRPGWPSTPLLVGRRRLTCASSSAVTPGTSARATAATLAGSDSTRSASPRRIESTIRRAARSASMDSSGRASLMLNHAYSAMAAFEAFEVVRARPVRHQIGRSEPGATHEQREERRSRAPGVMRPGRARSWCSRPSCR